jgi:hypothetical protein
LGGLAVHDERDNLRLRRRFRVADEVGGGQVPGDFGERAAAQVELLDLAGRRAGAFARLVLGPR